MTSRRPHLHALTGLRFIAAFWVVVFHLWRYDLWHAPKLIERAVAAGPLAVTLFFVLSGFVLTYTYAEGDAIVAKPTTFWRARFARIYPVHFLALLLAILPSWKWSHDISRLSIGALLSATMTQSWVPTFELVLNPPAWSIGTEAFFYLLFPFIAPRLFRFSKEKMLAIALFVCAVSVAIGFAYTIINPDNLTSIDHKSYGLYLNILKFNPLLRLPEFLLGIAAGRYYLQGFRLPPWAGWVALLLLALVIGSDVIPYIVVHNALLAPLFSVLIIGFAGSQGFLASRLFIKLGEGSYALYALHVPLFFWIAGIGHRTLHIMVLEKPAFAAIAVAFVVFVSLLVYRWFEKPMRTWLRKPR